MRTRIAHAVTVVAVALTSAGLLAGSFTIGDAAAAVRPDTVHTAALAARTPHAEIHRDARDRHADRLGSTGYRAPRALAPAPAPPPVPLTDATSVWTPDWQCIRIHESGDQYNSPAAPSGAYGILLSTWESFGLSGWPYQASAELQNEVALELYARDGWQPWSSRFACGL